MVPSVDARRWATAMTSLLLMSTLTGCVETTQEKSARAKLTADRVLASQLPVRVTGTHPRVSVLDVGLVRAGATSAVAVTLRNAAPSQLSDLPVSVGVRSGHGRVTYLNAAANLPYFQTHVGAIAAGATTTWVFTTTGAAVPAGARPFATIGFPTVTDNAGVAKLPAISASATSSASGPAGVTRVTVAVTNHSGVPQVGLAVYATGRSGGRLLAAGQTVVPQLDPGAATAVALRLVGSPAGATVQIDAPPTNLR